MKMWTRVLLVLALTCAPATVSAPNLEAQAVPAQRQELERRIRRAFQNRVRQNLELTQSEFQSLTEVVQWSEQERRDIAQRTRELNLLAIGYLRDGGSEGTAESILESRKALQQEEADLFAEEQDRLLAVLSPNQVVRYYRLRDGFNRQLLQARARRPGSGAPE